MAYRFGEPSKVQYSPYCGMLSPGSVVGIDPASQYKWTDMCTNQISKGLKEAYPFEKLTGFRL